MKKTAFVVFIFASSFFFLRWGIIEGKPETIEYALNLHFAFDLCCVISDYEASILTRLHQRYFHKRNEINFKANFFIQ